MLTKSIFKILSRIFSDQTKIYAKCRDLKEVCEFAPFAEEVNLVNT